MHLFNCELATYRKELLEKLVIKSIINELKKPQKIDEITIYLLNLQDELIRVNPTLKTLDNQKKQIELAINNILSAIERGVVLAQQLSD